MRASDFDENSEVTPGVFTFIEEGTNNADPGFVLTTDGSITIGTTNLEFSQFFRSRTNNSRYRDKQNWQYFRY